MKRNLLLIFSALAILNFILPQAMQGMEMQLNKGANDISEAALGTGRNVMLKQLFTTNRHELIGVSKEPSLETCIESMFLGPNAENAVMLEDFIIEAFRDHVYWRRNFHPNDPSHITEEIKRSSEYLKSYDLIQREFRFLLADLKKSLPTSSFRYQGHINWEISIPSLLGYFAAMLYNPNNVAFEGSPITSFMEEHVAYDFCELIRYKVRPQINSVHEIPMDWDPYEKIYSWGQLTSGGTTANIQALWAARNLKFFPLAVKWALQKDKDLAGARGVTVKLPRIVDEKVLIETDAILIEADAWSLLNIENDEILSLASKILNLIIKNREHSSANQPKDLSDVYEHIAKYSLQTKGILNIYSSIGEEKSKETPIAAPVVLASGTRHYSFPKAMSLMGLGSDNLIDIDVDLDARIDVEKLKTTLTKCVKNRQPIIAVVGVVGTTEESAVDDICSIINLRKDMFYTEGIYFSIHIDAAFGGYHASLLQNNEYHKVPVIPLNKHVHKQFKALSGSDSVTIDPHKSGYIPYPAGGLCFSDERIKYMLNFSAPVLGSREDLEPTVGIFGVEGSRTGAAAASVYLSHRVMPLTRDGHGKLLGQALYTTKEFFLRLLRMNEEGFFVVPLAQLLQKTTDRKKYLEEKKNLVNSFPFPFPKKNQNNIIDDYNKFCESLSEIGPDLNMLVYAFNFMENDETPNKDLKKANKFNQLIYNKLRPQPHKEVTQYKLLVSSSALDTKTYGAPCLNDYLVRLGITPPSESYAIDVLRSVVMNPWATDTEIGSTLEIVITNLIKAARDVFKEHNFNS